MKYIPCSICGTDSNTMNNTPTAANPIYQCKRCKTLY